MIRNNALRELERKTFARLVYDYLCGREKARAGLVKQNKLAKKKLMQMKRAHAAGESLIVRHAAGEDFTSVLQQYSPYKAQILVCLENINRKA